MEDTSPNRGKLRKFGTQVGVSIPTIEARFEHLNVEAEAYIGSRALPTFFNFIVNTVEATASEGQEANQMMTEYVLKILGLEMCADIVVGDEMLRGISGGQRKRVTTDDVKKWWIWGYWISPIMYEQNAMMVNEFLGQSWNHVLPNSTESLGIEVLKSRGFFTHASWYWIGAGALLGFVILLNITFTLALTYLNPLEKPRAVISKESHGNKHKDKSLEDIGLPLRLPGNAPSSNIEIGNLDDHGTESLHSWSTSVRQKAVVESTQRRKKGMVLPFEPHSLTFDEITYSVDMPQRLDLKSILSYHNSATATLMFGTMFWDLGSKTRRKQDLLNAIGSMYNSILFLGIQNASSVQPVVAIERTVFYRERAAGMYSAIPYALAQSIPVWWRWYYWACPVAWTLYGLVASQFGDVTSTVELNETVKEFLRRSFGYRDDFVGVAAVVVVGFAVLFAIIFALSVKVFNFERR
ncbi:ABC transporter G family member 40 [Spatholobus suberectus]|nr:ABC transporter G family member 40 [Spatholobus suberectus]